MEKRKPTSGVSPCGPGVQGLLLLCQEGHKGLPGCITQWRAAIVDGGQVSGLHGLPPWPHFPLKF